MKIRVLCFVLSVLMPAALPALAASKGEAKAPSGRSETLACRLGTEDRHARIAVVVVKGRTDSFAYYSKWKPRTCSIYLQRKGDMFSKWADNGALTTVSLEKGAFLIEHKNGEYHFIFRDIDRERYCGMDGKINGTLTIKRGSEACILGGDIMVEGTPLGQANAVAERPAEGPLADPPPVAASAPASAPAATAVSAPAAAPAAAPVAKTPAAAPVAKTPAAAPVASTPASTPPPASYSSAVQQPPQPASETVRVQAQETRAPSTAAAEPAAQSTAAAKPASPEKPAEAASANPFTSFFRSLSRSRPPEEQPNTP